MALWVVVVREVLRVVNGGRFRIVEGARRQTRRGQWGPHQCSPYWPRHTNRYGRKDTVVTKYLPYTGGEKENAYVYW